MYRTLAVAGALFCLASSAVAQSVEFTLAPSPKNQPACSAGNKTFAGKWSVAESKTTARVSGSTSVTLRKGADGIFGEAAQVANSTVMITFVNNGYERILKVTSKHLGCVWQGTSLDPRRA